MTLQNLMGKTLVGITVKVLDYNTGKVIVEATSGYVMGDWKIATREVKSIDVENNMMIIRVK